MMRRRILGPALLAAMGLSVTSAVVCREALDPPGDAELTRLQALIRPRAGESRWMEIGWHPSVHEARRIAAAEGKPIFFLAGSGGAPAAGC